MDKYEFNLKVEQIRKMINKGDYETAMKITDTIDWRKVRNANLLSMVSQVYEKNGEYQDAKDILLLAFERAPIGKRFLYKLTELALKEGSMDEAEAYYREFCDLSPDDSRQHLLRYMILKEENAPVEQLIRSLESYTSEELDEKWLYQLAELYHQAGNADRCVAICDKIMLMFGLGKYVDKAMELKLQYAPLTKRQMDLVENREKYEARLRNVEQSFQGGMENEEDYVEGTPDAGTDQRLEEPREPAQHAGLLGPNPIGVMDDSLIHEVVVQAETEENLKKEISKIAVEPYAEMEKGGDFGQTRVLKDIRRSVSQEEPAQEAEAGQTWTEKEGKDLPKGGYLAAGGGGGRAIRENNYLMIEARTPEKGLALAVDTLRKIQKQTGVKNPVAKITGSKLNIKGILANMDKLSGKDLMIEEAGDLSRQTINELEQFLAQDVDGVRVILIDNPRQMEMLYSQNPSLTSYFEWIASPDESNKEDTEPGALPEIEQPKEDNRPVRRVTPVQDAAMRAPDKVEQLQDLKEEPADDEELDIDTFAQYACKYASEIDCNITGKSMLALYERIEIMEEDGIPLTRPNAEALIEEAADKAEKPGLGKAIKGLFSSKYDKDGLLILKEEHFIS